MANIQSAKKRSRQANAKNALKSAQRASMRTMIKNVEEAIEDKDTEKAKSLFSSKLLGEITLDRSYCPVPGSSDYTAEMNRLHTSTTYADKKKYDDCLREEFEKNMRDDMAKGL